MLIGGIRFRAIAIRNLESRVLAYARTARRDTGLCSRRAGVAAAAFCMQLALGAVYGWSVFVNPLRQQFEVGKTEVNLTFTITLVVLGMTAGFGGNLQRRWGPRPNRDGSGRVVRIRRSSVRPRNQFESALFGARGVGRLGLGLGYIVPLAVLIR